jgi:hypothetical protein
MGDFLAANNPCGQNLLQLVATGNAIIAELLRLAEIVPQVFKVVNIRDAENRDARKYADELINNRAVRFKLLDFYELCFVFCLN